MVQEVTPIINGHRYSHASITIVAFDLRLTGILSIAYGSELKPGWVPGLDTERIGRTPGKSGQQCELEMLDREFRALIRKLGPGWGLKSFDIFVEFDERHRYDEDAGGEVEGVTIDHLLGCRITGNRYRSQVGTDPVAVSLEIEPVTIGYGAPDLTIDWRPDNATNIPTK